MISTFLSVMLLATLLMITITRLAAERLVRQHHGQKKDFFRHYAIQPGDIVFMGDSLTDGARWDELFPGMPIKNRGINADTTTGLLQRLGDILTGRPRAIFILIGTNDLPWYTYHSNTRILNNYELILKRIQSESPYTRVFIQSLLPRARFYARRIQQLNRQLEALAIQYHYEYISLYPHFADSHGKLRSELTNDNLHLMASGYMLWCEVLKPYLEGLKLKKNSQF